MGRWVTIHGHHVYLKDADEIDDSLKGKQLKDPMRIRTRYGNYSNFLGDEPDDEMKEDARDVQDSLSQIYKDQHNPVFGQGYDDERINDVLYDYYPQSMPGDDAEKLIRHNNKTGDMTFARIMANSNKTVDVRVHRVHEDDFSDQELRDSFGIEERAKDRVARQASMISPKVKALINKKSKHFTTQSTDNSTIYTNTQNKSWAKVYKNPAGEGYVVMHGNVLGDVANDLHGTNGTAMRMYKTAEIAHKRAQEYLVTINRRGY